MSQDQQHSNGAGRQIAKRAVKGTGKVVLAPFRAVAQSGKLTKDQYLNTLRFGKDSFTGAGEQIHENWQQAHKKGRNDQFFKIFGGPEGAKLLEMNLRRFLLKKRLALALMFGFLLYGLWSVAVFGSLFGLLGMLGAFVLGASLATEAQFRLWQLRNHRLSIEEKGSFSNFWEEQSILRIFDPELVGDRRHDR